jgi:hypothetical protein
MWVQVTDVKRRHLVGTLRNLPVGIPRLLPDDKIKFKRDHIIDIDWYDDDDDDDICLISASQEKCLDARDSRTACSGTQRRDRPLGTA